MTPTKPQPSVDDAHPTSRPEGDGVPWALRPFVNFVARIDARLESKLLGGFLAISVLMLALGIVGLLVVSRMDTQVSRLATLHAQSESANAMLYNITAQSHFRTMALLTGDPVWTEKIAVAKGQFTSLLGETESIALGEHGGLFDQLRAVDDRYTQAGRRVEALQESGDIDGALQAHVQSEHEISHELEDLLNDFIRDTRIQVVEETGRFGDDRRFLTVALGIFSAMSLAGAILVGAVISWSVLRPVRKIDDALDTIARGDFSARIDVPNRDEFGRLSSNVNRASEQLQTLYGTLEAVNQDLKSRIDEQVALLERTSQLRRYLSPHVADSIIAGDRGLSETRRAELTIVFADIRGFTALSERWEPEEMAESLSRFLSAMTDIVFRYEGTLDKYIGDALMVFFNDPLPQVDHAERAVRMALDMQRELVELSRELQLSALVEITAGIGIATGYVTVGNFGSPNRMDYTVVGNYVNLASRLADEAEPGEILITDRTLAMLPPGLVTAEPAGHHDLKGVQRPISLYRVTDGTPVVN